MVQLDSRTAINPYNPFIGMYAMCHRTTERGASSGEDQCISRIDALKSYTINGAKRSGEDKIKGSIEPGKLADFVVLKDDLLSLVHKAFSIWRWKRR